MPKCEEARTIGTVAHAGMKMDIEGDTLRISGVRELGAANANAFRDWVREAMMEGHPSVDIDLSQATFVDSCGLGALLSLHKAASRKKGVLRLLNPQPSVQQILELTRVNDILKIVTN